MPDDITSFSTCGDLEWHGCYGSGAKYNKYTIPESVKHPAKMSWELLARIFKHLESMNLLTSDSVVIDFMSGSGRTGTMAALRRYRTISVELETHFIEMMAGYDCDGKSITEFKIEPCPCKSDTLHKPHNIQTGLFEVECSGNPRIVPVCRCGGKRSHRKHHVPGNKELLEQVTGRKVKWDIIQGDARELTKLLPESGLVGLVSPPYFSQVAFQDKDFILSIAEDKSQRYRDGRIKGHFATPVAIQRYANKIMETYSLDPMNIGNLPDIPLAGIISPPYQDTAMPMGCPAHIRKLAREGKWDEAIALEREAEAEQAKKGNKFAVSTDETIRKKIEMALEREKGNYSEDAGNIGNLKDIPLVGVMSPPYQDSLVSGKLRREDAEKMYDSMVRNWGRKFSESDKEKQIELLMNRSGKSYSQSGDNIGNLPDISLVAIMSPPYSQAQEGGGIAIQGYRGSHMHEQGKNQPDKVRQRCGYKKEVHGSDPAQIGNLPDKAMAGITSPPYEGGGHHKGMLDSWGGADTPVSHNNRLNHGYGSTEGQIEDAPSYLSAMLKVYQQAFLCGISPLVVVTKNPTRNGALRRLDLDTIHLLQMSGYDIFDYHRAVLFEEQTQATLDGEKKKSPKGRLSFFKRLSYAKGTEIARFEDIIFARIPINCARSIKETGAPDSEG